ncbi:beta-defensin 126 [Camelus dromedarius]|uniref:Beta-defensin 126 n=2 Tax=Camelus TaxID=9836 RepID=A0A8B8RIY9_CAMFR|nr:beta-defensin 126 [Camelus bactrianus]XP_010992212.1 beta-defensin 126 [Camelus dromedarius]XP_032317079.1 beta-defensin 126 [Camelus ferus]
MKSLLFTLTFFILLAQLVSGNWYVRRCANKMGKCRSMCRNGEISVQPATGMCSKEKMCCILSNLCTEYSTMATTETTTGTTTEETAGGTTGGTAARTITRTTTRTTAGTSAKSMAA